MIMNKYTELSDFEINELVSFNLGYVHTKSFDPCNNPSDAMPIIIDNLISLMADMSEDGGATWWCASDISNGITSRYKSNPLRAAMEIFLMIKDAENEKV